MFKLFIFLSIALSNQCIIGQIECEGNKIKICSSQSKWIEEECPLKTKCVKDNNSAICQEDKDIIVFIEINLDGRRNFKFGRDSK